jgi:hypothetical protein
MLCVLEFLLACQELLNFTAETTVADTGCVPTTLTVRAVGHHSHAVIFIKIDLAVGEGTMTEFAAFRCISATETGSERAD